jgi:hypothetical protein
MMCTNYCKSKRLTKAQKQAKDDTRKAGERFRAKLAATFPQKIVRVETLSTIDGVPVTTRNWLQCGHMTETTIGPAIGDTQGCLCCAQEWAEEDPEDYQSFVADYHAGMIA